MENEQPVQGEDFGPFDGDTLDYRDYNFSDFAKGGLDLGSMMIPVPHEAEVQVEMGDDGPQMLHILTPFGRVTPVAFAAPTTGELWDNTVPTLIEGMTADGLEATTEEGHGVPRSLPSPATAHFGLPATGPRWMQTRWTRNRLSRWRRWREIIARTFVVRGTDPIPAGDPLPVQLPQAMVEELARHLEEQQNSPAQPQMPNEDGND